MGGRWNGTDCGSRRSAPASEVTELIRGRLEITGPVTAAALASALRVDPAIAEASLLALEAEGFVLRGGFTPGAAELEWCDRRLLARIHRYTLNRLRAEIAPVSTGDFMRYLFAWQRVTPEERGIGLEGLAAVIEQLDGYQVPAAAWESEVLSARCQEYDPALLDMLCLTGRVGWGRLSALGAPSGGNGGGNRPIRSTPIALFERDHTDLWLDLAGPRSPERSPPTRQSSVRFSRPGGASFFAELIGASGLLPTQVEQALGELAAQGWSPRTALPGCAPSSPHRPSESRSGSRRGDSGARRSASSGRDGGTGSGRSEEGGARRGEGKSASPSRSLREDPAASGMASSSTGCWHARACALPGASC
jgi:ATP-dependent Lhr-like helicase